MVRGETVTKLREKLPIRVYKSTSCKLSFLHAQKCTKRPSVSAGTTALSNVVYIRKINIFSLVLLDCPCLSADANILNNGKETCTFCLD